MRKLLLTATTLAGIASPALATLMISANLNGTIISCADGAACDTNPLPNQLKIADQTVNGVEIQGSSQFASSGANNDLNTSSFQIINHNLTAANGPGGGQRDQLHRSRGQLHGVWRWHLAERQRSRHHAHVLR